MDENIEPSSSTGTNQARPKVVGQYLEDGDAQLDRNMTVAIEGRPGVDVTGVLGNNVQAQDTLVMVNSDGANNGNATGAHFKGNFRGRDLTIGVNTNPDMIERMRNMNGDPASTPGRQADQSSHLC